MGDVNYDEIVEVLILNNEFADDDSTPVVFALGVDPLIWTEGRAQLVAQIGNQMTLDHLLRHLDHRGTASTLTEVDTGEERRVRRGAGEVIVPADWPGLVSLPILDVG